MDSFHFIENVSNELFSIFKLTPSSQVSAIPDVVTNGTGCADKTAKATVYRDLNKPEQSLYLHST